ncbi:MAG: HAD hydrolase-like protein [Clostridia bacterium]|nr:HAD hydrolase-like protein [Clostridia bacterium]
MYKNTKLLIWDIDGTLIQGRGIGRIAMDKAFFELYGIDSGFKGIEMAGRLDAAIVGDAFKLHGISDSDQNIFFSTYCRHLEYEVARLPGTIAAPGIIRLLELLLNEKNFFSILGTGNIEKGARIKLEKEKMNRFFPTGGFGGSRLERWQIIQEAIHNAQDYFDMEYIPENIYVIGDTPKDIECGKKLDIKSIAVATGMYSVQELQAYEPSYVFEDFTDTESFLKIF